MVIPSLRPRCGHMCVYIHADRHTNIYMLQSRNCDACVSLPLAYFQDPVWSHKIPASV